jgi:1,4-alpha-glucan branching enzyme
MKKVLSGLFLIPFLTTGMQAQVVTTDLPYFTIEDSINLTFDATQGNGNLNGLSPVYMHTGVISPSSDHEGHWQKQVSLWGEAEPTVQMTGIGGNQHTMAMNLSSFYGVSTGNKVRALAMVFRNADGSVVGQNADGSDIMIPVFESTTDLDAVIMDPIVPGKIVSQGDPVQFNVQTNDPSALVNLYMDGLLIGQGFGDDVSAGVNTTSIGKFELTSSVEANGQTVLDTTYFVVRPDVTVADPPAGIEPGITFMNSTTVTLCLWTPFKEFTYAIGDFSEWEVDPDFLMNRSVDGERHWITLNNVNAGQEYRFQYYVDGLFKIADPYSYKILEEYSDASINPIIYPNLIPYPEDLTHGNVSVFETDMPEYQWQTTGFTAPVKEDLVIYELLIRDFSLRKDFIAVKDSIPYLKSLGINAVQLMPIMEFEGNNSWGYNPIFFNAVDKRYGPADNLKELIDELHAEGIAVILDIVPNHAFGRNPYVKMYWDAGLQRPAWNSPYFNPVATHPFSVGYDFNHESGYVRTMWHRIFRYWIEEYNVDGYRLDLTKGLTQVNSGDDIGAWTQFDQSRVNILFDYANTMWSYAPDFHIIFEHLGDNTEETAIANGNVMLWSKATDQFNQASMGWPGDSDWGYQTSYQTKGWNMPRAISYMESHDEERLMYKNVLFGNGTNPDHMANDTATSLFRMQGLGAMFFLIPGPKMIWQFGELGYDFSINWPSGTEETRVDAKPVRWNYMWEEPRQVLYSVWSALIKLKHEQPVYSCTDYGLDLGGTGKRMWLSHPDMNVSVTYNSDVTGFDMTPDFQHTGTWYNYFTGEPYEVNQTSQTLYYGPGQYYVFTDQPLPIPDTSFVPFPEENPDDISETDRSALKVYPNPTSSSAIIEFELDGENLQSIEVLDLMGRTVDQLNISNSRNAGLNRFKWNADGFENGQYIFKVVTDKQIRSKMIAIQR